MIFGIPEIGSGTKIFLPTVYAVSVKEQKEEQMTKRKVVWVSPDGKGGWDAKTQGSQRAAGNYADKAEALGKAKEVAKNAPFGQVKVQRRDGKIQTEYTYGKDPRRTPG